MITEPGGGLFTLWASNGSPDALASVPAIRRWLVPASRQIDIVSVAPVDRSLSRRVMHWTEQQRAKDLEGAIEAVNRSIEALGDVGVPVEAHTRWGTPSREIVLQAEESRADIVVVGAGSTATLQKAVLGSTAEQTLMDSSKSVLLAREQTANETGPVIVLFTSQRLFANSIAMLNALRLSDETHVRLIALLEPVKPFGSMFLTLNEEIRVKEQAAYDAQADVLRNHLAQVASHLPDAERRAIGTAVEDCEPRDMAAVIEAMQPALVIIGDNVHADPMSTERRSLKQLATRLSSCVLVAR